MVMFIDLAEPWIPPPGTPAVETTQVGPEPCAKDSAPTQPIEA